MKKILLVLMALILMGSAAYAANRKRIIDPESLPKPAIELIQKPWPSCVLDQAYIDGKEYEVLLSDGTIIEFDSKGIWKEMKCTDGLPVTLVPGYITRYIVDVTPSSSSSTVRRCVAATKSSSPMAWKSSSTSKAASPTSTTEPNPISQHHKRMSPRHPLFLWDFYKSPRRGELINNTAHAEVAVP